MLPARLAGSGARGLHQRASRRIPRGVGSLCSWIDGPVRNTRALLPKKCRTRCSPRFSGDSGPRVKAAKASAQSRSDPAPDVSTASSGTGMVRTRPFFVLAKRTCSFSNWLRVIDSASSHRAPVARQSLATGRVWLLVDAAHLFNTNRHSSRVKYLSPAVVAKKTGLDRRRWGGLLRTT